MIDYAQKVGTVDSSHTYTLSVSTDGTPQYTRFLFEGAGIGSGDLVLTIYKNADPIASTSVSIQLNDIKEMYEQVSFEKISTDFPPSTLTSEFKILRPLSDNISEAKQTIVFVHGINNTEWEYQNTSETMFKRLYWSGYQGRFASFRWPSPLLPNCIFPLRGSVANAKKGEYLAFKSANALKDYLHSLTNRLPGYTINVFAHSMGGVVASEALRLGGPFNNCILSQAAVPAHSFDVNTPFLQKFLTAEGIKATPLHAADGGYHGYLTNLSGNIVNFYNPDDFALVNGECGPLETNWEKYHETRKPESIGSPPASYELYGFNTNTLESYVDISVGGTVVTRTLTDAYEKKAMVARSRSKAVGALANVGGIINANSSIDLQSPSLGTFGNSRSEHSAQFNRSVQNSRPYYLEILRAINPPTP